MMSRLLATFGLLTLMVSLVSAQDKPSLLDKPTAEGEVQKALQAAGDDLPKAISILDKAIKQFPDNREVLFLLGAMSVVQGEEVKDKVERIALFHKSTAAFARLAKLNKDLKPNEKAFMGRSQIGEARALALEGKVQESMATIQRAMALGFDDLDALESEKDLDAVSKLPEFRASVESAYKASVAAQKKEVTEEIAQTKSFPFDFELKDTDDKTVTLADYKGKVTIVDIWGTWCPPCREGDPPLRRSLPAIQGQRAGDRRASTATRARKAGWTARRRRSRNSQDRTRSNTNASSMMRRPSPRSPASRGIPRPCSSTARARSG